MQLELPGINDGIGPPGFAYREDLLPASEQYRLVRAIAAIPLQPFRMHGVDARRRVAHFGWSYGYDQRSITPGEPIPDLLLPLRERCAALAGTPPGAFEEVLVTAYPAGAGIGWHRDAPQFGRVAGVSLLAPCRLKLRHRGPGGEQLAMVLAPGSAYVLAGAARWQWQHSIPMVAALRYSITFRTLRGRSSGAGSRR